MSPDVAPKEPRLFDVASNWIGLFDVESKRPGLFDAEPNEAWLLFDAEPNEACLLFDAGRTGLVRRGAERRGQPGLPGRAGHRRLGLGHHLHGKEDDGAQAAGLRTP